MCIRLLFYPLLFLMGGCLSSGDLPQNFQDFSPLSEQEVPAPSDSEIDETGEGSSAESTQGTSETSDDEQSPAIPDSHEIDMQFYPQAPFGDWGDPFQEACEEASMLLAVNRIRGHEMTREEFNEALLAMIGAETDFLGFYEDTAVADLQSFSWDYFPDIPTEIFDEPTEDDIKAVLLSNRLVLLPVYGKALANPYYSGEGPDYHMLVVSGYYGDEFITQDVGTKRGANYFYDADVLIAAIHDYDEEDILNGPARMLVVGTE